MIKTKICKICSKEGKYKCPTCFIHYCSVTCCKQHKNKCEPSTVLKKAHGDEEQYEKKRRIDTVDSTVPRTTLEMLKTNKALKDLLENPHLRNLLAVIDKSENVEDIMQKAMQEPIFVEFADACLKVVDPRDENEDS